MEIPVLEAPKERDTVLEVTEERDTRGFRGKRYLRLQRKEIPEASKERDT
jgi:hypothetical protein